MTKEAISSLSSLRRHRVGVVVLYAIALLLTHLVLKLPDAQKDVVALLSAGAILATFGSALATLGSIWERDLLERVRLNVDILFKDLLAQPIPWRRWPFLPRAGSRSGLDGSVLSGTLVNPDVQLDVGTHLIDIQLPTVLEDFFDLPLRKNFLTLRKFRAAATTTYQTNREAEPPQSGDGARRQVGDQHLLYECLYDIWQSIFVFRLARYATHLGAGITLTSTLLTGLHLALRVA